MGVQQELILVAVGFSMFFFQKLSENEIEHPEQGDIELLMLRGIQSWCQNVWEIWWISLKNNAWSTGWCPIHDLTYQKYFNRISSRKHL